MTFPYALIRASLLLAGKTCWSSGKYRKSFPWMVRKFYILKCNMLTFVLPLSFLSVVDSVVYCQIFCKYWELGKRNKKIG